MTISMKLDDLTGLQTRSILDELDLQFSAVAGKNIWSILMIDIDHFKLVNDVYGHLQGNSVLKRIARIIAGNCRGEDTLLRYGGDEFVIVMPFTEQLKAVNQAERILQCLAAEVFSEGMDIGLSIGAAESSPEDTHLSQILERAEKALYEAKNGERGRVSFNKGTHAQSTGREMSFDHFVGREKEISTLRNTLNATINGEGCFALISGEPGIGKSRLAQELRHYSGYKNCLYLECSCNEFGADRPYHQIADPIAHHLLTLSMDELNTLKKTLPAILPQTAELFPGLNLKLSKIQYSDEDGVLRFKIYSEIFSVLKWIVSRQPVIFMVDNLQWISANEFDLFSYLVRTTTELPILFLSTIKAPTSDFPEIQRKVRILSSLVKFTSIKLEQLASEYTKHMILYALRDPEMPGEVLEKLVEQSNGNPMYVKELLLSLRSNGAIEPDEEGGWRYSITDDLPLPATISQLMSARLEGLDSFAREILCAGSLMPGGCFTIGPICNTLQRDELDVAKALEKPLRLELIRERFSHSSNIEYSFIHDTLRSYFFQELEPGSRKALQSRFGLYYESIYDTGDSSAVPQAALHYCDSLESEKAMHFALLAAGQAEEWDAKCEVLRWLEQYMSFTDCTEENNRNAYSTRLELGKLYILFAENDKAAQMLKEAAESASGKDQLAHIRLQEAHLHFNMGDYPAAEKLYEAAVESLPPGKDKILSKIQTSFIQYLSGSEAESLKLLEAVKAEIQDVKNKRDRKQLLALYYMRHGTAALETLSRTNSTEECLKAVTIYRQLDDKTGEAKALLSTAVSLFATSKYKARIGILNDALEVFKQTGDTHSIMATCVNLGQAYYNAMEYDLSRDCFQSCLDLVEATGTKRFGVWANSYLAVLDTQEKNFSEAEKRYGKAIEDAEELGLAPMALNARMNLVTMLINKGDFTQADIHLTRLETDEVKKVMSSEVLRSLQGYRGTERMGNPSLERATALKQAETNLRSATSYTEDHPSIRLMDLLAKLTECLHEQNKLDEARRTLTRAQNIFNSFVSNIDSNHYRQKMLNSITAKNLNKLSKLLD